MWRWYVSWLEIRNLKLGNIEPYRVIHRVIRFHHYNFLDDRDILVLPIRVYLGNHQQSHETWVMQGQRRVSWLRGVYVAFDVPKIE
jgi:hypothetical protein